MMRYFIFSLIICLLVLNISTSLADEKQSIVYKYSLDELIKKAEENIKKAEAKLKKLKDK